MNYKKIYMFFECVFLVEILGKLQAYGDSIMSMKVKADMCGR